MPVPGVIITAPASGCGKTTLTMGLLRTLCDTGLRVAPTKSGPDYIDPVFHQTAARRTSANLDSWAMRPETLRAAVDQLAADTDLILCEGAMGLFDGAAGGAGSTADLAAKTGWPCILVVGVQGQAQSAAAIVEGFCNHRPGVRIAGVIFNNVASDRHQDLLRQAMDAVQGITVLGYIPKDHRLHVPSRHLGLVQASEHDALEPFIATAADIVAAHIEISAIQHLAAPGRAIVPTPGDSAFIDPIGQRIAIAQDTAFAFVYPGLLHHWQSNGVELSFFSPLADEAPATDCDAVYLPGGYPELHAGRLADNEIFLNGLRAAAAANTVIFGECGGYMVLGDSLTDKDGHSHNMAGLLPVSTSFAQPKRHLGYRRVQTCSTTPLGVAGTRFCGHEFHYAATVTEGPGNPLFHAEDASGKNLGETGLIHGSVMGSFIHLIDKAA